MRTVNLIQFTNHDYPQMGEEVELFKWFKLYDLNADIEWTNEDDEEDYYNTIIVQDGVWVNLNGEARPNLEYIVTTDDTYTKYNLMTIELDDDSQLFK